MSTAVRLAPFNLPQIRAITDHDDMDLYTLGEKKCALYAVIPDNDNTYNFLVSLLYSQVFQTLYYCADQIHHGPLPRHGFARTAAWNLVGNDITEEAQTVSYRLSHDDASDGYWPH